MGAQMRLLVALVTLLCTYTPGTVLPSILFPDREVVFSDNRTHSLWNCLQRMESRDVVVLNTWRTGGRFSVTVDCWWSSVVVLATSSMDTKPTVVCLGTGPGTLQSVSVRSLIAEYTVLLSVDLFIWQKTTCIPFQLSTVHVFPSVLQALDAPAWGRSPTGQAAWMMKAPG